jgi:hypothetical protein
MAEKRKMEVKAKPASLRQWIDSDLPVRRRQNRMMEFDSLVGAQIFVNEISIHVLAK